jgi:hypothetical protein
MDEKPRIVAYKLIIDANIVKHRGSTERQNIVHAMEANMGRFPTWAWLTFFDTYFHCLTMGFWSMATS